MKNILSLSILLLLIFSCTQENIENTTENTILSNDNSKIKLPLSKSTIEYEDVYTELSLIELQYRNRLLAYLTGRILLKYPRMRSTILYRLGDDDSISFNNLFFYEYNNEITFDFLLAEAFETEHKLLGAKPGSTPTRQVPPITKGKSSLTINTLLATIETNCFELYFPRPLMLTSTDQHLFISSHPLTENIDDLAEFEGFELWQEIIISIDSETLSYNEGNYVKFNNYLLQNNNYNVVVVRPIRTEVCTYENVNVSDFTEFFQD